MKEDIRICNIEIENTTQCFIEKTLYVVNVPSIHVVIIPCQYV